MATNSLAHLVLFRPTRCPGDGCCRDAAAPSLVYIGGALCTGSSAKSSSVLRGVTKPSPGRSVTRGRRRFVEQWRAYEAHLQSLAERADIKIHRARKLAALTDITSERERWRPGAEKGTVAQLWLLPWLLGAGDHFYRGPWVATHEPQLRSPPRGPGRPKLTAVPDKRLAFLAPLPLHAAFVVLRFIGHVTDDNGQIIFHREHRARCTVGGGEGKRRGHYTFSLHITGRA